MTTTYSLAPALALGTAGAPPFLRLPDLATLYERRAARLRRLALGRGAAGHPIDDYLRFIADVACAQHKAAAGLPSPAAPDPAILQRALDCGAPPFSRNRLKLEPAWLMRLNTIVKALGEAAAPEPAREALECLGSMSFVAREKLAHRFLSGEIADENAAKAMFVGAALAVYWAGMSRGVSLAQAQQPSEPCGTCPICGSPPVGSVFGGALGGGAAGVRYLHCSLCEAEWRYPRGACANCGSTDNVAYLGFEDDPGPVRAECCGDCGSYLKALNLGGASGGDVVADDLATLSLDYRLVEEGSQRYGYSPFLLTL